MKLEEQVVSLEIARRLKELGVPQNSIYHWTAHNSRGGQFRIHRGKLGPFRNSIKYWSAFTVAELGEMLPKWHDSCKRDNDDWHVRVFEKDKDNMVHNSFDKKEVDARAKMLIHLIENKLMEVPK